MADELLQFLGLEGKPVLTQFIEEVANKGLQQYQGVIQWGEHHGQSLYNHIVSGVFLIHTLQEVLQLNEEGLTEEELKTLMIAFCIHDLNKTYEGQETSYSRIATPENIAKEIEKIGFDWFFSNWRDYIEDITELARGHSGHNSVRGNSLDRRSDLTRIGKSRLNKLCEIIRAVDVADLSHSYSERKHKQTCLSHFNSFSKKQYRLIAHQVSEQRGLLTNIIHNEVAEFLRGNFDALPIFLYPQGTYYLVSIGTNLTLPDEDLILIGKTVEKKINQMKFDEFSKFIKPGNQGIKVDEELFKLGVLCSDIFGYVDTIIQKKSYETREMNLKVREKLKKSLEKQKDLEKGIIQLWLQEDSVIPDNEELVRLGELLRTFYIFLKKHCTQILIEQNKDFRDPWIYLYKLLKIKGQQRYEVFDALYDRAYVIASKLEITYDGLHNLIISESTLLIANKIEEKRIDDENKFNEEAIEDLTRRNDLITFYVRDNVIFDFLLPSIQEFKRNLITYVQGDYRQSCYASSNSETSKWMSGNVPGGIKVQQFSNRLRGGQREPKRYIDAIGREQFSIEKLNYESGKEKAIYLHIMPYSFMTAPFIESFKKIIFDLRRIDVSAVNFSIKEAIQFFDKELYFVLPVKYQKTLGLLLPKYSDLVGNIISLPLNPIGNNKTEKYLNAIEYAFLIYRHFGVKVLLSDLSIPVLNLTEHEKIDIFLDGIPSTLRGLAVSSELYFQRNKGKESLGSGDILWQRLHAIREMYDLLWTDSKENELLSMAQAFAKSEDYIFFVVDRMIEKKAEFEHKRSKRKKKPIDRDFVARYLAKQLKPWIEQIVEVGSNI